MVKTKLNEHKPSPSTSFGLTVNRSFIELIPRPLVGGEPFE